jgi:cation diffusion facilitator family transporter
MTIGTPFHYPPEQTEARTRMIRVCQLSCALLFSGAMLLYATVGDSQSMKTAWMTDLLTLLPPLALLIALRYERREPTKRFPFGYTRSTSVAYLVTAATLSIMGIFLAIDSALKLLHQERPAIGLMHLFGHSFWAGWAMIGALAYSMTIGITIGRLKQPIAKVLYSKPLAADATSNSAEWMSEGAAIIGLVLVAYGHWWGDALAALFISVEVIRDGWLSIRLVVGDLMDESPTSLKDERLEELPERVRRATEGLGWVKRAAVRLREHGHAVTGEVFVEPHDPHGALAHVAGVSEGLRRLDWRLHDLVVVLVPRLDDREPPRVESGGGAPVLSG